MKRIVVAVLFLVFAQSVFAQLISAPESFTTLYEQEILFNPSATHLELFMAYGEKASASRTAEVKLKIDSFVAEIKETDLLQLSEVKLMKELHKRVHKKFLTNYKYNCYFPEIFEAGHYNCVTATALFALILEELKIPYTIQEQPTHVYIMAYPSTKAISVEMTALDDAYYLPARKDVSKAVRMLVTSGFVTQQQVLEQGEQKVYQSFFNSNGVINLYQLAGIQYFNAAITDINAGSVHAAYSNSCKTDRYYKAPKNVFLQKELLESILETNTYKSLFDFKYLIEYARKEGDRKQYVSYQYISLIQEQLLKKGNRSLVDSCQAYMVETLTDTSVKKELSALYYLGMSEYYSNAYNLKKKLEYAGYAHVSSPSNLAILRWLSESIVDVLVENYESEELIEKMDEYMVQFPLLRNYNHFQMIYFYACTDASNEYYMDDEEEWGKKYFDLAISTRNSMEDKEVLKEEQIGWLYAEAGAFLLRKQRNKEALILLEEGLLLAPDHERIVARLAIANERLK